MNTLTITHYDRRDRQAVYDLLFRTPLLHSHLDWHRTDQWLNVPEHKLLLAWHQDKLTGVLGLSAPLNHSAWLRIAAFSDDLPVEQVLPPLWNALHEHLHTLEIRQLALLLIEDWIRPYLPLMGFEHSEDIITLSRGSSTPPPDHTSNISVRPAMIYDIEQMLAIDHKAFNPPWQMSLDDLQYAKKLASNCTVALENEQILGYQLSTMYQHNGHLARLAVSPDAQGKGIGSILLNDLIWRFLRRNVQTISVNTQASNLRSQSLYERFGFHRNGYDLAVWLKTFDYSESQDGRKSS